MPSFCSLVGEGTQKHDVQPMKTSRRGLFLEAVCYVQPSTHGLLRREPLELHQGSRPQFCPRLLLLGRWCSMSISEEKVLWWDRDADRAGRPIRLDVRAAAHGIWPCACSQAESLISDGSQAADIMESTVLQVSRYLDRNGVVVFSREMEGLLMIAFQRALYRRIAKLRRVEGWGGTGELSHRVVDRTWARQVHVHLELDEVVRRLCERSRMILALRYAGYTWKESAKLLGASVSALRSAFWRDVARVKRELKTGHSERTGSQAEKEVTTTDPCG
jgi:DNA-directed RNA polymerase specialized sigma24 family protein